MEMPLLLARLSAALEAGVSMVQIWENWAEVKNQTDLISAVCSLCGRYSVPVFINNLWEMTKNFPADGVHFDQIPRDFGAIRAILPNKYFGLTCGNSLETVKWAHQNRLDYISFCSVFPSNTSNSCELVTFETIRAARNLTDLPIFLAGGIMPDRMKQLDDLPYQGVAVISGVMSSESPSIAVGQYLKHLSDKKN